jgi:hypothetical protein
LAQSVLAASCGFPGAATSPCLLDRDYVSLIDFGGGPSVRPDPFLFDLLKSLTGSG